MSGDTQTRIEDATARALQAYKIEQLEKTVAAHSAGFEKLSDGFLEMQTRQQERERNLAIKLSIIAAIISGVFRLLGIALSSYFGG